jgi:TPR repeat protein
MKAHRLIWTPLLLWLAAAVQVPGQPNTNAAGSQFEAVRARAQKGDAEAMLSLATLYANGDGVRKDLGQAARLHRKAAEQGLARAQSLVGVDYANGDGVKMDKTEAVRWFRKAADQGLAGAQYNLALCYADGLVAGKTAADAVALYRQAAQQGLPAAEHALGECYFNGIGVPKDIAEGVKWIRQAAEQGNASAQNTLGLCYTKGKGVTQDYVEAYKWLNLAAAQDDPNTLDIKVNLSAAERFLTPEQISEGQRRAREFKPHKTSTPSEVPSPTVSANSRPPGAGAVPTSTPNSPSATTVPSKTGLVNVKADDESQEIFVDGAFVGNTPAKLKLAEGSHVVEVKKPGFKDYRKEIKVAEGSELTLRVVLEKQ